MGRFFRHSDSPKPCAHNIIHCVELIRHKLCVTVTKSHSRPQICRRTTQKCRLRALGTLQSSNIYKRERNYTCTPDGNNKSRNGHKHTTNCYKSCQKFYYQTSETLSWKMPSFVSSYYFFQAAVGSLQLNELPGVYNFSHGNTLFQSIPAFQQCFQL